MGRTWARSPIRRELKPRYWDKSKTSKEGNARINKVFAMKPGLAKIIEKLRISRYFECSETDHHIAANARSVDYIHTGTSQWVYYLLKNQGTNCSPTHYGCENTVKFDSGVAWASLPIMRIHPRMAEGSTLLWFPVTLQNRRWMYNWQVSRVSFKAIPIMDSVDVEKADGHTESCHYRV